MEHGDSREGNISSTKDDPVSPASLFPPAASASQQSITQPEPASEFLDSFNSSGFFLYLGCDSGEMEEEEEEEDDDDEEEEEELRDAKEKPEKEGLPSPIPRLKFSSKFTLTPTVAKESEEFEQLCAQSTPNQAPSTSVDCPERPSKLHRTSTSQYESSMSCRLLFSAVAPATPALIAEEENSNDHHYASSSPSGRQSPVFKVAMEDPATPIHSPSSSSSSCSDCVECSSSASTSPIIATPYPLASPIMSQIKLTSQTIMSSPEGDTVQEPAVEEVLNLPFPTPHPHGTADKLEDAMKKEQATKDSPLITANQMDVEEEVSSTAMNANTDPLEASLAPSSTGSVHSNWTVISGISPLPASDPAHHHRHRHHHHHHHGHHHGHHHHHHHHRKHQDESLKADNVLTSTPIHQKCVVKTVDVSAVASSQDAVSDPKFVLTSELVFPDSQSNGREEAVEGEEGVRCITGSSGSDKESRGPECLPISVPAPPHQTGCNVPVEEESMKPKRPRQSNEKKVLCRKSQRWSYPPGRPLSKAEAKALLAAHVNFSEDILVPDHFPSPHLSSTVDESLFRDVPHEPRLSATLD